MKNIIIVIMCIFVVLSVASCGSNTNEIPEQDNLKIVLDYVPNTNHTGIYVALEKGYFKDEGLNVSVEMPPEDGASALVASGGADIGVDFQDLLAAPFSKDEPLPVTAVAAILQHNTSGIVSLKGNGMDRPKGMEGKTYASWESPIEQAIIKHVVEKDGGDYSKIDVVPYTITDTFAGLNANIDAVWIYYGWDGVAAKTKGIDIDYFDFASVDPAFDYYTPVFIANNDFLKKEPEKAKAALRALKKGYEFAVENPGEGAEILLKCVPELDRELVMESQKWMAGQYIADAPKWGYIDEKRWDTFYQWLYEKKLIEKEIQSGFGCSNEYLE